MGHTVLVCATVGILVGLFASAFFAMIEWVKVFTLETLTGYSPALATGEKPLFHAIAGFADYSFLNGIHPQAGHFLAGLIAFVLPGVGAFLAALIAHKLSPSASGHGTDSVIAAYHHQATNMPASVAPVKMLAASLVIGTGGSAGCEGPVTQIGAAVASCCGRIMRLTKVDQRVLIAVGLAAGVGAIFRAPMAGALFAAEIFYRGFDVEGEVLIPSMVASSVAYVTFACFFGWAPVFSTPGSQFASPWALIPYTILAVIVALFVRMNIMVFRQFEMFFRKRCYNALLRPFVGGLMTGFVGLFLPEILGSGYGVIQQVLLPNDVVWMDLGHWSLYAGLIFLLIAVAKVFTTSFTVGSGGSGGLLGPALFCGALIGAAVGSTFEFFAPELDIQIADFAMVGMAAYLTAAVRTPLAAMLMVSEFTGNHSLLLPAMWVCGLAFTLTPGWTLYKSQFRDRFASPLHNKQQQESKAFSLSEHHGTSGEWISKIKRNRKKKRKS